MGHSRDVEHQQPVNTLLVRSSAAAATTGSASFLLGWLQLGSNLLGWTLFGCLALETMVAGLRHIGAAARDSAVLRMSFRISESCHAQSLRTLSEIPQDPQLCGCWPSTVSSPLLLSDRLTVGLMTVKLYLLFFSLLLQYTMLDLNDCVSITNTTAMLLFPPWSIKHHPICILRGYLYVWWIVKSR